VSTLQLNTVQWLVAARRYRAAEGLERARQVIRENVRYGFPVTQPQTDAVRFAEHEYDQATKQADWAGAR
jgi:hypothetical protein